MSFNGRRDREKGNIYKPDHTMYCKHEPDYDNVIQQKDELNKNFKIKGCVTLQNQT